jgi:hypothetical protein
VLAALRSPTLAGSLVASAQSVSAREMTPDSVFQVMVSDDNAYVASVSRRKVLLTDVAARGSGGLLSAVGRMASTQAFLCGATDTGGGAAAAAPGAPTLSAAPAATAGALAGPSVPLVSLSTCMASAAMAAAAAGPAAGGAVSVAGLSLSGGLAPLGGRGAPPPAASALYTLPAPARLAWEQALSSADARLAEDVAAVGDATRTPAAASVLAIAAGYLPAPGTLSAAAGGAAALGAAGASAALAAPSHAASGLPPTLVSAIASRCVREIQCPPATAAAPGAAAGAGAAATASGRKRKRTASAEPAASALPAAGAASPDADAFGPFGVSVALRFLFRMGLPSAAAAPELLPALLACAASRPQARGAKKGRKSGSATPAAAGPATGPRRSVAQRAAALQLLCEALQAMPGIPETQLVRIFGWSVERMPAAVLAAAWALVSGGRGAGGAAAADAPTAGASAAVAAAPASSKKARGAAGAPAPASVAAVAAGEGKHGKAAGAAPATADAALEPATLFLTYLTGCIVRAPRNDVFLEQALARLPVVVAGTLLGVLARLLAWHGNTAPRSLPTLQALDRAAAAAEEAAAEAAEHTSAAALARRAAPLALPSFGQVLDWSRMTVDAHFSRFVISANAAGAAAATASLTAPGAGGVGAAGCATSQQALLLRTLRDVMTVVKAQVALGDAAALLRGSVLHMLNAGSLPLPPPSDHFMELLEL